MFENDTFNERNGNVLLMSSNTLKHITVNEDNYYALKRLGNAADSFNDVITELLKKIESLQTDLRVGPLSQSAVVNPTNTMEMMR
jgi:predicted CopG family antitoxin